MHLSRTFEYPQELQSKFNSVKKIEWITLLYFSSASILMAIVMGNSQTMKTAWIEDAISIIPPLSFLIISRIYKRKPDKNLPYGYHRVAGISFLISAVALTFIGFFLLIDSSFKLLKVEHPTINTMMISGHQVWMGYIMIAVLIYSTVPSIILGLKKLPLAKEIADKAVYTDAVMNKADWLSGIAGMCGIAGIGIGWWWMDSVAAIVISADILHDGISNLKQSVLDLMNQLPKTMDKKEPDPVFDRIKKETEKEDWVKKAEVRFRQEGHVYFGEIFIVASDHANLNHRTEELRKKLTSIDWRIFDLTIMVVEEL